MIGINVMHDVIEILLAPVKNCWNCMTKCKHPQ